MNRISFAVRKGEIFGFLGPNGAGKSTTIRMLCGILLPTSGTGHVAGYDITREPERVKQNIGYMSQRFSLYPDLLAGENLEFYAGVYGVARKERSARIREVSELTAIGERLAEPTKILTGGWRQRLALACALVHRPSIVFLDEPTSGVDPISRRHFWDIIQELAVREMTVFVTTHYLEEAEYCHRMALINNGLIVAMGAPKEMKGKFPYPILELEASPLMDALGILEKEPSLGDLSIWGNTLHVVLKEGEKSRERLLDALRNGGIAVQRAEPLSPTLEDVFVLLASEERRGENS